MTAAVAATLVAGPVDAGRLTTPGEEAMENHHCSVEGLVPARERMTLPPELVGNHR